MKRRSFLALASGLLVPAYEPVRAYSFLDGNGLDVVAPLVLGQGIEGDHIALTNDRTGRSLRVSDAEGRALFSASFRCAAEFIFHRGRWVCAGYVRAEEAITGA